MISKTIFGLHTNKELLIYFSQLIEELDRIIYKIQGKDKVLIDLDNYKKYRYPYIGLAKNKELRILAM